MKIEIKHSLEAQPETTIIPISGESLSEALPSIAAETGIDTHQLFADFKAEPAEVHLLYRSASSRYFLLGLGEKPDFPQVLRAFRSFAFKWRQKLEPAIGISFLHHNSQGWPANWTEAAANGLILGTYTTGKFKTSGDDDHPFRSPDASLTLLTEAAEAAAARTAAERGQMVAETQMAIFDLVNAPSNKKLPTDLGDWALQSGERHGFSVRVLDKQQIERTGLQALLAVNQGSPSPPVFIIMEYRPRNAGDASLPKVGLVGKGVTFDTGGLSIKPSTNMHLMKSDMGGAGAVLGAMEISARLQLPVHLIGIVPATDNSVDALSVKPGDVIGSYSGKTIEVIDTDAEGRLILADGLAYLIQQYQPEILIDLATLTGSTVRTFGYHAAGLFTQNDKLAEALSRIGEHTGERLWRLPLWDVYKEDLKSDVADVRNFSGKPVAGAINAAKFLEVFTFDHKAWVHLDIASVAFGDSEFASQKSATAYGVRLLLEFLSEVQKLDYGS